MWQKGLSAQNFGPKTVCPSSAWRRCRYYVGTVTSPPARPVAVRGAPDRRDPHRGRGCCSAVRNGLEEMRQHGLITDRDEWVPEPLSLIEWTKQTHYLDFWHTPAVSVVGYTQVSTGH